MMREEFKTLVSEKRKKEQEWY
jgi:hypothetical protein